MSNLLGRFEKQKKLFWISYTQRQHAANIRNDWDKYGIDTHDQLYLSWSICPYMSLTDPFIEFSIIISYLFNLWIYEPLHASHGPMHYEVPNCSLAISFIFTLVTEPEKNIYRGSAPLPQKLKRGFTVVQKHTAVQGRHEAQKIGGEGQLFWEKVDIFLKVWREKLKIFEFFSRWARF